MDTPKPDLAEYNTCLKVLSYYIEQKDIAPLLALMPVHMIRELNNLLWIEIYEIDQANERRKEAGTYKEETKSYKGKN